MSDSDSSENELLKLSDDDDDEESYEGGGEEFDMPNSKNINIRDFLLIKFERRKSLEEGSQLAKIEDHVKSAGRCVPAPATVRRVTLFRGIN
ncbi:hypothetical protein EVAR_48094_1 [Eumeta japonica]|uniref:Uncharacterized protein n=1 Tax=Eumeta variegata TaxID=151549 RepID=A0A4C1XIV6_EUMVA|nr:hypothetical protein EVAR_48094_1 [Eumeta japonica]